MQYANRKIGGLDAIVGLPVGTPRQAVILFHGFGANARDLAPLSSELRADPDTIWIFPEGKLALDSFGSRAWWQIDMAALELALAEGRHRDRTLESPPGLPPAREAAMALLAGVEAEFGVGIGQTILGGFSQGAMLATDVTLHLPLKTAGLLLFSGTLLCQDVWMELAPRQAGLHFFQSHGRTDPILGFEAAHMLNQLLTEAGLIGDLLAFPGGHEIPRPVLEGATKFLNEAFAQAAG